MKMWARDPWIWPLDGPPTLGTTSISQASGAAASTRSQYAVDCFIASMIAAFAVGAGLGKVCRSTPGGRPV